jgi:undecaprenyl-diphosphatase
MNPAVLSGQTSIFVTFIASFLIWFMFGGLFILWVIDGRIKKEQVLHALLATLLAWVLAQMIKNLFPTPRPFEINGRLPFTLFVPSSSAFPSGHASAAFGLATSIWLHDKKLGVVFVVLAVLVGLGRVLSNVHYFLDIVGGLIIGISTAYTVQKLHLNKLL